MMIDIVCHAQKQKYSKLNENQVYTKKHRETFYHEQTVQRFEGDKLQP